MKIDSRMNNKVIEKTTSIIWDEMIKLHRDSNHHIIYSNYIDIDDYFSDIESDIMEKINEN